MEYAGKTSGVMSKLMPKAEQRSVVSEAPYYGASNDQQEGEAAGASWS